MGGRHRGPQGRPPLRGRGSGASLLRAGRAGSEPALTALQRAFTEHHALQCGFCTAGFLMTADALLRRRPDADEAEIRAELAGNLCRCTGYEGIVAAVLAAREDYAEGRGTTPSPLGRTE